MKRGIPMRGCPEAILHGPADRFGRCPWCKQKWTHTQPLHIGPTDWQDDLDQAYRRTYDPDWGVARFDHDPGLMHWIQL